MGQNQQWQSLPRPLLAADMPLTLCIVFSGFTVESKLLSQAVLLLLHAGRGVDDAVSEMAKVEKAMAKRMRHHLPSVRRIMAGDGVWGSYRQKLDAADDDNELTDEQWACSCSGIAAEAAKHLSPVQKAACAGVWHTVSGFRGNAGLCASLQARGLTVQDHGGFLHSGHLQRHYWELCRCTLQRCFAA